MDKETQQEQQLDNTGAEEYHQGDWVISCHDPLDFAIERAYGPFTDAASAVDFGQEDETIQKNYQWTVIPLEFPIPIDEPTTLEEQPAEDPLGASQPCPPEESA